MRKSGGETRPRSTARSYPVAATTETTRGGAIASHTRAHCTFPLTVRIVSLIHICTTNQCTGSPAPLPQSSSCQEYPTCADDVQTILCTVQGGSHCGSYSSFGIAQLAWGVLQNYAVP